MSLPLLVTFVAGASGTWRIDRLTAVIGDGLPAAERLAVLEGSEAPAPTETLVPATQQYSVRDQGQLLLPLDAARPGIRAGGTLRKRMTFEGLVDEVERMAAVGEKPVGRYGRD